MPCDRDLLDWYRWGYQRGEEEEFDVEGPAREVEWWEEEVGGRASEELSVSAGSR